MALLVSLPTQAQNPQVQQGGGKRFGPTGTEAPTNSQTWDITSPAGQIIATSSNPNGWTAVYNNAGPMIAGVPVNHLTVTAPLTAAIAQNYKVRAIFQGGVTNISSAFRPVSYRKPYPYCFNAYSTLRSYASAAPVNTPGSAYFDVIANPNPPIPLTATSLSPSGTIAGSSDFPLTITGTGFTSGATTDTVNFGTTSVPATNVTATQVTATIPAALVAGIATTNVSVTDSGQTSNSLPFTTFALQGAAPSYVAVYATGANSIRIYWQPVPGATGYAIYRATTSGGYNFATPIFTTGPAAANYDDYGLTTGQQYFYVIETILGTAQSGPSDEDSDTPDPTAIPWNGSPSAILSQIRQSESNQPGLPISLANTALRVMMPDGTICADGNSNFSQTGLPAGHRQL